MVKIRNIYKTFTNFHTKGITHQKLLKLMKAIMLSKNIIGGYLKPILANPTCNPICKPKNQLNAKH